MKVIKLQLNSSPSLARTNLVIFLSDLRTIVTLPSIQLKKMLFMGLNEISLQELFNHAIVFENSKYFKCDHGTEKLKSTPFRISWQFLSRRNLHKMYVVWLRLLILKSVMTPKQTKVSQKRIDLFKLAVSKKTAISGNK